MQSLLDEIISNTVADCVDSRVHVGFSPYEDEGGDLLEVDHASQPRNDTKHDMEDSDPYLQTDLQTDIRARIQKARDGHAEIMATGKDNGNGEASLHAPTFNDSLSIGEDAGSIDLGFPFAHANTSQSAVQFGEQVLSRKGIHALRAISHEETPIAESTFRGAEYDRGTHSDIDVNSLEEEDFLASTHKLKEQGPALKGNKDDKDYKIQGLEGEIIRLRSKHEELLLTTESMMTNAMIEQERAMEEQRQIEESLREQLWVATHQNSQVESLTSEVEQLKKQLREEQKNLRIAVCKLGKCEKQQNASRPTTMYAHNAMGKKKDPVVLSKLAKRVGWNSHILDQDGGDSSDDDDSFS